MERIVDLDRAAAVLAGEAALWRDRGVVFGPVTWRDAEASWPQPLETDRARVGDPDSLGVVARGPDDAELVVVLFRGGWADVEFAASLDDFGMLPASDIVSAEDFGARLAQWLRRAFDPHPGGLARAPSCTLDRTHGKWPEVGGEQ
ncbi:hypothetical protein [Streptomyces sp. ML-6]|uniref:hypothetical protein n=1 Tax=Streptomyces sp. ML-6 TaxID=2982693 RepID=UPI0024C05E33|nr:hypothetical protein [Streptomyces sp. ML-6]MDK0523177.1 hypothetical protein [Streptomyces sp. ML-6]